MPDAARNPDTENADTFADLSGAMADALDEVVVVEDLLALIHLAGMALDRPTGGAVSGGAMAARQHVNRLRDHIQIARQELSKLSAPHGPEGAA